MKKICFLFLLLTLTLAALAQNKFRGRTIVVLGDSYVRNHRCPYSETWHARVAERLGLNYRNYGRNGSSIAFDRSQRGFGPAMLYRYREMTDTADVVLVIAGHNDATLVGTSKDSLQLFRQRLDSLCMGLRAKYPRAGIGFVTPWAVELPGFAEVTQILREVCARHGFPVLDAARTSGIRPMDADFRRRYFQQENDQAHLNADGHALLLDWGERFVRALLVPSVTWDRQSLMIGGHRVVPVMGEIHYSRIPANEWAEEIRKMKEGGVTLIATYVFWNHIEEQEGIFDWSGQRNLRRFLQLCQDAQLPVILRIGPYCHGEVRCGGIPDWVVSSGCKLRSEDPSFLTCVETLYRQIFTQVQGLQWKDGGPVIACQFDNEYGGHASYLMSLKSIARNIGFDLPFYTRTGWPEMRTPTPFGELIPLYGDYADGFWDRSSREGVGNYWKAFHFKAFRSSTAIATEQINNQRETVTKGDEQYPYFTCELGGGMMTSYHRRVYVYPEDAYGMALVKLGSGSNLLGYYMYHGGTNPEGKLTYLNENQRTLATNHNDLPVKTYDFQAPLGEFGQKNPHYYSLRPLHLFMQDFGELLAPMEAVFPVKAEAKQHDDSFLRWSYRIAMSENRSGGLDSSAFVFVNNYERFANLTEKRDVRFKVAGVQFPRHPMNIPASAMAVFPVNLPLSGGHVLNYATAQPVARRDGKIWFEQKAGIPAEFSIDGRVRTIKHTSMSVPFTTVSGEELYLISSEEAGRLFLDTPRSPSCIGEVAVNKVHEAGPQREITLGVQRVAEEPVDADFNQAAVYTIELPQDTLCYVPHAAWLEINYRGDVARLYANGRLIGDNFYNGRPFLMGLWRLPKDVRELELRILPLQPQMPVYFPREADTTPGETVLSVKLLKD